MSKPIVLYSHKGVRRSCHVSSPPDSNSKSQGPNPWKVAIILEELGLKYENKFLTSMEEVKAKPYTDKNPNGR